MKYFKLIDNSLIIGVITSNNFMHYNSISDGYMRADEQIGEYVSYKGRFYRDGWMQPFIRQERYQELTIIEIDENEYNILLEALKVEETIVHVQQVEDVKEERIIPEDTTSIEFLKTSKINEMSYTCNQLIESGFDVELSDGLTHHFSLTTQDQLNLITLSNMAAQGVQQIPYHADGELCCFYSPADINTIVNQATVFKTYHTTYYNALKNYINHLDNIEDIAAVTYGMELPLEYQTDVLKALT